MIRGHWDIPIICDGCGDEQDKVIYDARSKSGSWGLFCGRCFIEKGYKLGTGHGQSYQIVIASKEGHPTQFERVWEKTGG